VAKSEKNSFFLLEAKKTTFFAKNVTEKMSNIKIQSALAQLFQPPLSHAHVYKVSWLI